MELNLIAFSTFLIWFISLIDQGSSQRYQPTQNTSLQNNNSTGNLRRCYICNSHRDPFCSDEKFDKNLVQKVYCHENIKVRRSFVNGTNITHPFVCRKVYQRVTAGDRYDVRIDRSCGYMPPSKRSYEDEEDEEIPEDRCYKRAGTYEVMVVYCTCLEDDCNHGTKSIGGSGLWIPLIASLVSLTISKKVL